MTRQRVFQQPLRCAHRSMCTRRSLYCPYQARYEIQLAGTLSCASRLRVCVDVRFLDIAVFSSETYPSLRCRTTTASRLMRTPVPHALHGDRTLNLYVSLCRIVSQCHSCRCAVSHLDENVRLRLFVPMRWSANARVVL